jgi:hypothetical protein
MKIKYILWVICALLLLNTSATFAEEIGGTSTLGKVGFLEKEPIDKPPETSKAINITKIQASNNKKLPIVGTDENELLMPIAMAFMMIGSGGLVMRMTKLIKIKENFNEKNNN